MPTGTDVKLDLIITQLHGIEDCLYGADGEPGMRIDVDRLKRAQTTRNAVLWVTITSILGITGTVIAGIISH